MTNWKLLPTDLTPEMKVAGLNKIGLALRVGMPEYDLTDGIEMAWDAMLEVAPTPPEPTPVYQRWMGEDMWQDCTKKQAKKPIIGDGSRTLFTYPISNAGPVRAAAFEAWAISEGRSIKLASEYSPQVYASSASNNALDGWNARQPEIDALKAEVVSWKATSAERSEKVASLFDELITLKAECDALKICMQGLAQERDGAQRNYRLCKAENEKLRTEAHNPSFDELLGIAPDATGEQSSEDFIKDQRTGWRE